MPWCACGRYFPVIRLHELINSSYRHADQLIQLRVAIDSIMHGDVYSWKLFLHGYFIHGLVSIKNKSEIVYEYPPRYSWIEKWLTL